jgi:hypothetical protein
VVTKAGLEALEKKSLLSVPGIEQRPPHNALIPSFVTAGSRYRGAGGMRVPKCLCPFYIQGAQK